MHKINVTKVTHKSKIYKLTFLNKYEQFMQLYTAILPNLKGNSKLGIIRQPNSILNLLILPNS